MPKCNYCGNEIDGDIIEVLNVRKGDSFIRIANLHTYCFQELALHFVIEVGTIGDDRPHRD